jgi:hypothetical protein
MNNSVIIAVCFACIAMDRAQAGKSILPLQHDAIVFANLPQSPVKDRAPRLVGDAPASHLAPPPLANFNGYIDDGRAPSIPDCMGAAGPNHLMITINGLVIIQRRDGQTISSVSSDTFWSGLGSGAFDPRLYYDPYGNRWIFSSGLDEQSATSALLLAVSATSDPTGTWFRYKVDADPTDTSWADYPKLGFNGRWIVLQANMEPLSGTANTEANTSHLFVFNKTNVYAGGTGQFTYISVPEDAFQAYDIVPSATYDPNLQSMFLLALRPDPRGSWTDYPPLLRIYELTGAFGSEALHLRTNAIAPITWPPGRGAASGYQLGTPQVIRILEKSLENVIYRNGTLWTVHNMFPTDTSDQSDIQFWQITTNGQVLQFGRVEDPSGTNRYGFPSIAVNKSNDVLIAYTRFASNSYISAKFTFHAGSDASGTIRGDTILKAGEAPFTIGSPDVYDVLRWGDYTQTVVDPVNDTDFWTLQEYAATDTNSVPGYGLWWGRFVPPSAWPRFVDQQRSNSNFVLTFTTSFSNNYNLERATNVPAATWQLVQTNIIGTGALLQSTVTNPFPAQQSYFRMRLVP